MAKKLKIVKLLLKDWVYLEEYRQQLKQAIDKQDVERTVSTLTSYLSISFPKEKIDLENLFWEDVRELFIVAFVTNMPDKKFPILNGGDEDNPVFDYFGRDWYSWLNMLASQYGWTPEYIAKLQVDDAIGLLQEIIWDEQQKKEWEWARTDHAYSYDKQTEKSTFTPYPRPKWLKSDKTNTVSNERPAMLKVKIPIGMIPIGLVINTPQDMAAYDNKTSSYLSD